MVHLWVRAEVPSSHPRGQERTSTQPKTDRRAPITPFDAARLVSEYKVEITVERSSDRCFADEEYSAAGCRLVEDGAWLHAAPDDAVILGLRDVDSDVLSLRHKHIFFAHAFKGQNGWQDSLLRFARGGGSLLDLEFLVDETGHRLVSFGRNAGAIGMAAGILAWCRQKIEFAHIPGNLVFQMDNSHLESKIEGFLQLAVRVCGRLPRILVIGAKGRCGSGAASFAKSVGLEDSLSEWGRESTRKPGPYLELLDFDIVVNAIRLDSQSCVVFLDNESIRHAPRKLCVLVDISCDPTSPSNPLPLYSHSCSFEEPCFRLIDSGSGTAGRLPLDLIAIPNLSSLLPVDSSTDFSKQLVEYLPAITDFSSPPWSLCLDSYNLALARAFDQLDVSLPRATDSCKNTHFVSRIGLGLKAISEEILQASLKRCFSFDNVIVIRASSESEVLQPRSTEENTVVASYFITGFETILSLSSYDVLDNRSCAVIVDLWSKNLRDYLQNGSLSSFPLAVYSSSQKETETVLFWNNVNELSRSLPAIQLPTDFSFAPSRDAWKTNCVMESLLDSSSIQTLLSVYKGIPLRVAAHLLGCLCVLVSRWGNELQFCIGFALFQRFLSRFATTLGNFEVPVRLPIQIEENFSFENLYSFLRDTLKSMILNESSVLASRDTPRLEVRFSDEFFGLSSILSKAKVCSPLFEIVPYNTQLRCHFIWKSAEEIYLRAVYDQTLFVKDTLDEFCRQYRTILRQSLLKRSQSIFDFDLNEDSVGGVVPDPRILLSNKWEGSICDKLTQISSAFADNLAVKDSVGEKSYHDLFQDVVGLAATIVEAGIKKGDVIAIYGYRSYAVVVAVLGILRAGCSYCMIDPKYPVSRISACLEISRPKGWFEIEGAPSVSPELLDCLKSFRTEGLIGFWHQVKRDAKYTATAPSSFPEILADDIAVITFTSGSTGKPKGVLGRHGPLTHFYPWMKDTFSLKKDDRFSMCSGIAHDPLQRDIFTPIFFGATIYIPSDQDITEPGALARWFSENKISVTCLTPAMGQLLNSTSEDIKINSLRHAFFVGDCLIKRDVSRLWDIAPNVNCVNMYGSTETQRAVGYYIVPRDFHRCKEVIAVGKGMIDVQLIILNKKGVLAGIGETAEIYVRSPHLAHGYVGLELQTSEKFIVNPFTHLEWDRLYKTGDLGRYRSDGSVECAGRADDQVKIRGYRIELGEINAYLSKHRAVRENVVVLREDVPGQKRIVAYVVFNSSVDGRHASDVVDDIREFLRRQLPSYMVPSAFVPLECMPLTPNGKVNRAGLPRPEDMNMEGFSSSDLHVLTDTEQAIESIWAKNFGISTVPIHSDFFDLGGHSLLATKVTLEISQVLDFKIPLGLLFSNPTISKLAASIDNLKSGVTSVSVMSHVPIQKLENDSQLPSDIATLLASIETSFRIPETDPVILLTGCTGFLGSFLLAEILDRIAESTVVCLVRAPSTELALTRIRKSLEMHQKWKHSYSARIQAVKSDLSLPLLGLTEQDFQELSINVDLIIHNGAIVHWLLPYEQVKPANVHSTIELLRLAGTGKTKPLHFVSTTSVYDSSAYKDALEIKEESPLASCHGLEGGYPQSKWVSEQLLFAAKEMGFPCCIYRPGYRDSTHGLWNTDDFLCRFIKGCVEMHSSPFMEFHFGEPGAERIPCPTVDMAPVDYVARSIVHIALRSNGACYKKLSFNVVNPHPPRFWELFDRVGSFGYEIAHLPYKSWRLKLIEVLRKGGLQSSLFPIASQFSEEWYDNLRKPIYDCSNVLELNKLNSGPTCPNVLDNVFLYLSYMIRCGFLPPPSDETHAKLFLDWNMIGENVQRLCRTNRH